MRPSSRGGVTGPAEEDRVPSRFRVGWATDVGQVRSRNEDAMLAMEIGQQGGVGLPPLGLFVLADGMGGHRAGDVASALAIRAVAQYVLEQVYLPTLSGEEQGASLPALQEILVEAVRLANAAVTSAVPGAGTTLTCALLVASQAYIAHVGDSRAYLVRGDRLEQITRDHSLVDRLVELGELTEGEAAHDPRRNVLYRAIGQDGQLEVDTYLQHIPPGGRLLLCSDGLWGAVEKEEIARLIASAPSLQAACEAMVRAANDAGGRDNITVMLIEPPEG